MKKQKDETTMIIVTPKQLKQMKLGLRERTKIRERQAQRRRDQYYK